MISLMSVSRFDVDEYIMNNSFCSFVENKIMGEKRIKIRDARLEQMNTEYWVRLQLRHNNE